jgi:hypothetical protein
MTVLLVKPRNRVVLLSLKDSGSQTRTALIQELSPGWRLFGRTYEEWAAMPTGTHEVPAGYDPAADYSPTGVGEPESYDPENLHNVAIHEAGHAVATIVLGLLLNSVNILPVRQQDGRMRRGIVDSPYSEDDIAGKGESAVMPYLVQGISGPTAERKVNREYHRHNGGDSDFERAKRLTAIALYGYADADHVVITAEQRAQMNLLLNSAQIESTRLVEDRWPAIKKVAALLQDRHELSGDEVAMVVKSTPCRSYLPQRGPV